MLFSEQGWYREKNLFTPSVVTLTACCGVERFFYLIKKMQDIHSQ
ncbi:hypothetical protein BpOF4_03030 [Alkalihalophilus pseudofirmus OF4]|uniref:Uncharacterized protein n=1 Tax=Alkalihalophilus pseudofirmus (strain ATCC BAA-2126 / JCM 17055 / OF4) TaxID=398511 RepID=D3FWE1_ALKPO|nr:hypothetical protein BpOF4_03030 [Alkalihalophilus pseudofirmus OF4]